MIPTLIILFLLSGGFNAKNLDLSDPVVLAEFRENVSTIVEDPYRAANVSNAVYNLNIASHRTSKADGVVVQEVQKFRSVVGNYKATQAEAHAALKKLETSLINVNLGTIEGREAIRQNTTKSEWKKLLKKLSK